MPRRKRQSEAKGREPGAATSDNIYSVNLQATPHCLKRLLAREKLKFLKIGCGCGECVPGSGVTAGALGRHRPTAEELFLDACCEPAPNPQHVRLIFHGAQGLDYNLRLVRRGLMNALSAGRLSAEDRARAMRLLDYFDVDGERRRTERRALIQEQRQRLLAGDNISQASGGVPGGPDAS